MEIERKWLLKGRPKINYSARYVVFSSYLVTGDVEVRVREAILDHSFSLVPASQIISPKKLTIKSKGTLVRHEVESEITNAQYEDLLDMIGKPPILREYYLASVEGRTVEVSHIDNDWWYMEIEFRSEEDAMMYQLPASLTNCIEAEVTEDPAYKMQNYWKRTRLEEEVTEATTQAPARWNRIGYGKLTSDGYEVKYQCSACGVVVTEQPTDPEDYIFDNYKACPRCVAEMRKEKGDLSHE